MTTTAATGYAQGSDHAPPRRSVPPRAADRPFQGHPAQRHDRPRQVAPPKAAVMVPQGHPARPRRRSRRRPRPSQGHPARPRRRSRRRPRPSQGRPARSATLMAKAIALRGRPPRAAISPPKRSSRPRRPNAPPSIASATRTRLGGLRLHSHTRRPTAREHHPAQRHDRRPGKAFHPRQRSWSRKATRPVPGDAHGEGQGPPRPPGPSSAMLMAKAIALPGRPPRAAISPPKRSSRPRRPQRPALDRVSRARPARRAPAGCGSARRMRVARR